jgi:hypothetical protein
MDAFTISLPDSTSPSDQREIEAALQQVKDVEGAGISEPRAIDPVSILVWVKLAAGVITAAGAAMPVIQQVVELIRGKGIKGAKINLPGGATVEVDEASTSDIERVLHAST